MACDCVSVFDQFLPLSPLPFLQDGTPVLHMAIEKRMESVALKLIAAGCDVSLVDKVNIASKIFLDNDFKFHLEGSIVVLSF